MLKVKRQSHKCVHWRCLFNIKEISLISFSQETHGEIRRKSYEEIIFWNHIWVQFCKFFNYCLVHSLQLDESYFERHSGTLQCTSLLKSRVMSLWILCWYYPCTCLLQLCTWVGLAQSCITACSEECSYLLLLQLNPAPLWRWNTILLCLMDSSVLCISNFKSNFVFVLFSGAINLVQLQFWVKFCFCFV